MLRLLQGDMEQAVAYAGAATELAAEIEDRYSQVMGGMVLACCARAEGQTTRALKLSGEASQIAFRYGYVPLIQELAWLMAYLYPQQGERR